jgi:hypothetical protein
MLFASQKLVVFDEELMIKQLRQSRKSRKLGATAEQMCGSK